MRFSTSFWTICWLPVQGKWYAVLQRALKYIRLITILYFRRYKVKAAFSGDPIPLDASIFRSFLKYWFGLLIYLTCITLLNTTFQWRIFPPYETCLKHNPDPVPPALKDLRWGSRVVVMLPCLLVVLINIYYDIDDPPIFIPPRLSSINRQENTFPIWDESFIKTSYISIAALAILIVTELDVFGTSNHKSRKLILFNVTFIILNLKGPLIALWIYYCERNHHAKKVDPDNLQELNSELASITSEGQQLREIESRLWWFNEKNVKFSMLWKLSVCAKSLSKTQSQ